MAFASMSIKASMAFRHCNNTTNPSSSCFNSNTVQLKLFVSPSLQNHQVLPSSTITFARRRNSQSPITSPPLSSKKSKKILSRNDAGDDNLDDDAFEALFKQLEEDLKNDPDLADVDEDLSEEDLAQLERELEEMLGDGDDPLGLLNATTDDVESDNDVKDVEDGEDDEDEIKPVKLKNWQLKRLAYALKTGRRKTNIKSLAAELCLDRAVVLEYLRDPPSNLLLMSASLPDKPTPVIVEPKPEPEPEVMDIVPAEIIADADAAEAKVDVKLPVHAMQGQWSSQKRIKKVHIETLERVYRRSKRPTNAMVSSIVQVTNLPRKRVVKWFEDKRAEDGVPDKHAAYQRSSSETVFSGQ